MRLSGEQRAAIRERVEAATPGPWRVVQPEPLNRDGDYHQFVGFRREPLDRWWDEDSTLLNDADAAFIAASRTDVPLLLDALEEAEREVEREVERLRALIETTRL